MNLMKSFTESLWLIVNRHAIESAHLQNNRKLSQFHKKSCNNSSDPVFPSISISKFNFRTNNRIISITCVLYSWNVIKLLAPNGLNMWPNADGPLARLNTMFGCFCFDISSMAVPQSAPILRALIWESALGEQSDKANTRPKFTDSRPKKAH